MAHAARAIVLVLLASGGCGIERGGLLQPGTPDARAGGNDTGTADPRDSGGPDSPDPADAGPPDAGPQDSGLPDAGPPDSGPPDGGSLDGGPDWAELCRARYGDTGFILCWAAEGECGFNADTMSSDCNRYCGDRGGTCLDAHDNPNDEGLECEMTADDSDDCRTDRGTELCVCSI